MQTLEEKKALLQRAIDEVKAVEISDEGQYCWELFHPVFLGDWYVIDDPR